MNDTNLLEGDLFLQEQDWGKDIRLPNLWLESRPVGRALKIPERGFFCAPAEEALGELTSGLEKLLR